MTSAWTLMTIGGFGLLLVSLFADSIGLGTNPTFGWRQIAGVILGLLLILSAPYMKRRRERMVAGKEPEPDA